LPLIDFGGEGFSYRRLAETVDAARECRSAAISAKDHFLFSAPWLDGLTALAAVAERSGGMKLVTTLALASLRGPVPLAKAFSALDILSGGRVIAGVGPGSSKADYEAVGVPFEQRWQRFDEAARLLKALLQPGAAADTGTSGSAALPGLAPAPRRPAVDRKLGLPSRLAPRRQSWRWLACLCLQHHPRGLRRGHEAPWPGTRKAGEADHRFPERAGHNLGLDHR
jgi:alkanesulfonate monooxygenase SsuD/methylene tetrahydromethanopterin reductase-like flavin-dependent oxidoreductase (luciferase family)